MTISAQLCHDTALKYGCNESTIYRYDDLDKSFRAKNSEVLSIELGAGLWIWKVQVCLQELQKCDPGDYVVYTDGGVEFVNSIGFLINAMDEPVMLFQNQWWHHEWCKGDALHAGQVKQLQASCMIFKACYESLEFVNTWKNLCEIPHLIDDTPSKLPNHPDFQEHRRDQSLLTAAQLFYGYKGHWWPAEYLNGKFCYPKNPGQTDTYPIIFHHHRKRNHEWE